MIQNVEKQTDNYKAVNGIGLYKIKYEMDVKGRDRSETAYIAGVVAYNSEEAVQTLINFAKTKIKGFKGLKIDEVAFEGLCHAMSDGVRDAVIKGAINDGVVIDKAEYDKVMMASKPKTKSTTTKKSIVPKG